jgi:hypothetical protein
MCVCVCVCVVVVVEVVIEDVLSYVCLRVCLYLSVCMCVCVCVCVYARKYIMYNFVYTTLFPCKSELVRRKTIINIHTHIHTFVPFFLCEPTCLIREMPAKKPKKRLFQNTNMRNKLQYAQNVPLSLLAHTYAGMFTRAHTHTPQTHKHTNTHTHTCQIRERPAKGASDDSGISAKNHNVNCLIHAPTTKQRPAQSRPSVYPSRPKHYGQIFTYLVTSLGGPYNLSPQTERL